MKRALSLYLLCVIGLGLAGCKSASPEQASASPPGPAKQAAANPLPAGWSKFEAGQGAYSISLAPEWKGMDLTVTDKSKILDEVEPGLKSTVQDMLKNDTYKLFAYRTPEKEDPYTPSVNLIVIPTPGGTFEEVVKGSEDKIKSLTGGKYTSSPITFDDGDTGQVFTWQNKVPAGDKTMDLDTWSYVMLKSGNCCVLTVGVPALGTKALHDEAQTMAKSLSVK